MYPEKEVFGIRTEYEWDDIKALDRAIGGSGTVRNEGKAVSHGSEHFEQAPLTEQAYHKLCCVLHDEIALYFDILKRAVNLNKAAVDDAIDGVLRKCGILKIEAFVTWQQECHDHVERDKPHLIGKGLVTRRKKRRKSETEVQDGQSLGDGMH